MKIFLSSTYVELKDQRSDPETLRVPLRDSAFESGVAPPRPSPSPNSIHGIIISIFYFGLGEGARRAGGAVHRVQEENNWQHRENPHHRIQCPTDATPTSTRKPSSYNYKVGFV